MNAEGRLRAGRAVEARMADLGCTAAQLAQKAGVDPKTIRGLLSGRTWPTRRTQAAIAHALEWSPGELLRRATAVTPLVRGGTPLDAYSTTELLEEVLRRATAYETAAWGEASGTTDRSAGT